MGARGYSNSEPVHEVSISQPFYFGIYPVTQAQFAAWTESENIDHENEFHGNPNHPAENMDWHQAREWCEWLMTVCNKIPDGFRARLPTEAEWEYACGSWCDSTAGRIYTEYHTGDGESALCEAGWFGALSGGGNNSQNNTRVVGQLSANRFGFYDMHGNVDEWCLDVYESDTYRSRPAGICNPFYEGGDCHRADPFKLSAPRDGAYRVIRGGSWLNLAVNCRAACRYRRPPDDRFGDLGFRVGLFPVRSCQTKQPAV